MNLIPLAPIVILVALSIVIILAGLFLKTKQKINLGYLTILVLLGSLAVVVKNGFIPTQYYFYNTLVIDTLSQFFNMVFLIVAILVAIASIKYYENNPNQDEYYSLLLLGTVGMMIVGSSSDLITLFVGFELASLSTYVLAGFDKKDPRSLEAALKYFIIGAISSGILLFGMSLVYGITGSTNLAVIFSTLSTSSAASLAVILLVAGFGFKMALVPFHMWAPDTYEGAPTPITALLAAGSKKMAFIAAFRVFMIALIAVKTDWFLVFAVLAVISMTLGNVVAIVQKSVKRMLAYSSIAHAGYIAIAFVVVAYSLENAQLENAQFALAGGILHVLSHGIMTAGAFIAVALVGYMVLSDKKGPALDHIDSYSGLGKRAPITALMLTLLLFALAGIPPTFGFYSKFVLFLSAIRADLLWLAVIAVLNSALSVYYYAKVFMTMYWGEPTGGRIKESLPYVTAMVIAVILIMVLGIYPEPIYNWAISSAGALLGG